MRESGRKKASGAEYENVERLGRTCCQSRSWRWRQTLSEASFADRKLQKVGEFFGAIIIEFTGASSNHQSSCTKLS